MLTTIPARFRFATFVFTSYLKVRKSKFYEVNQMNYIDKINSKKEVENLSIRKLSDISDVSANSLKDILSKKAVPRVSTVEKICEALGISLARLFCSENEVVFGSDKKTSDFFHAFEGLSDEARTHMLWLIKKLSGH